MKLGVLDVCSKPIDPVYDPLGRALVQVLKVFERGFQEADLVHVSTQGLVVLQPRNELFLSLLWQRRFSGGGVAYEGVLS